METRLGSIKAFVQRFADIISNTVDTDVIIVDNNLTIIGNAFRYFGLYNKIEEGSVIYEVITRKEKVIVEDKSAVLKCRACKQFEECKMVGFVGVPIFYDTYVIGAISLILPQHRVKTLFETLDTSVEFLENMAELLSGKLRNNDENQSLARSVAEREILMDLLNDCVIYTDLFGNIQHVNEAFRTHFMIRGDCTGKKIQNVISHKVFTDYFKDTRELDGERFYYESGEVSFYGIVSSRRVESNGMEFGVMFCLRTINDIVKDVNLSQMGSMVTFKWASWALPQGVLEKAKGLAVTPYNILLEGKNWNLNEIAAKGIVNASERRLNGMKKIFCDNMYRDLLEAFLFDEFGELKMADKGTVFIHNIENLPLYLQERLLIFLKTGRIYVDNYRYTYSDVRFIFSTAKDLKSMVEKGYFLEELCLRLMEHRLKVPGIQENREVFQNMLESGLAFYREKYRKRDVTLSPDAVNFLWKYKWNENLNLLESKLETIVRRNDGLVTQEELRDMGTFHELRQEDMSLSSLEKEKISELLNAGYSKTRIAKVLGIGRATLYRKLDEYQLN